MDTRRLDDGGITYEQGVTMVYVQLFYHILVTFVSYPVTFSGGLSDSCKQKQTVSLQ